MANLQKAQIIKANNDIVWVKHPDLSSNLRTHLTANITAAGTTLTVLDNDGWADDYFMVIGYPGVARSEEIDVNGTVTRGTALTITNTTKFNHSIDDPITFIKERKVRIKSAATLTGSQTEVTGSPFTIQWDKPFTKCIVTGNTNTYYFAEYSDAAGSPAYGAQSDGVLATGLGSTTIEEMIQNALRLTGERIQDEGLLTRPNLLEEANNWQDDITARRDWSWELLTDQTITSTEMENEYALSGLATSLKHPNSAQSVVSVKFGSTILDWIDWHKFEEEMEGRIKTTLASAVTAADTTATLTDSYEFGESGTIIVGSDSATYTTNTESTGVLSGIPVSAFASNHSSGANVWQGVTGGTPNKYTIYNDKFYADVPIRSEDAGIKFKLNYYKQLSRVSDFADTTDIPFAYLAQYFIAARIEFMKGNFDRGNQWLAMYEGKVALEVKKDRQPSQKRFVAEDPNVGSFGHRYRSTESNRFNNS